ncbi:hypothetical protein JL721_8182 [Aureococcus anophagefferens]|nr:hypothetical protein JL721_8182 [Aureococcus anophagefferens]
MVRGLTLALALARHRWACSGDRAIQRVAPVNMETLSTSTGTASMPMGAPKNAPGAESTILVQGGSLCTWSYRSPSSTRSRSCFDGGPP